MAKEYYQIKNWDKWQSYRKDRGTPPWIKVHRNLMTNMEWAMLSDAEKGQLVSLWILAADKNGKIPANKKILQKICCLDKEPDIEKFIELQFLTDCDNQMTTRCQPDDAPETETETETDKKEDKKIKKLSDLENHPLDGHYAEWFKKNCPSINRFKKRDDIIFYCRQHGKQYKDYWATLQNWARKDQEKIKNKPSGDRRDEMRELMKG